MTEDTKKLRKTFSANIKKYRAKLGFSQEKLAECAGVSGQTINDIEGCRTWVSDKTIVKIARALEIEVFQLLHPQSEAEKIFPVQFPADILLDLRSNLEKDIARRFGEIITG
jgi:transcriptional regulator with XRE-family HTH domain